MDTLITDDFATQLIVEEVATFGNPYLNIINGKQALIAAIRAGLKTISVIDVQGNRAVAEIEGLYLTSENDILGDIAVVEVK